MLYALPLVMAAGCDKTEEGHWPGTEPTNVLSIEGEPNVMLNADGTEQEIIVHARCEWDVVFTEVQNDFECTTTTNEGDGVIKISRGHNYNTKKAQVSTIELRAKNFDKYNITINLNQAFVDVTMPSASYPTVGEEGGDVDLKYKSTIEWKFTTPDESDANKLEWLDFSKGATGIGNYNDITNVVTWKPNYSLEAREVTLVLNPGDDSLNAFISERPDPFTLRQEAGTLPTQVAATVNNVGYTDASVEVSYQSKSPVTECGVRVRDSSGEVLKTVAADKTGNSYPQNGTVGVNVSGLEEGKRYLLEPYVTNMVGETEVEQSLEITTKHDVVYEGVKITKYEVTPSSDMVTVTVTVTSDVKVEKAQINIYKDNASITEKEESLDGKVPLDGTAYTFEIRSDNVLTPNTDYELEIVFGAELIYEEPKRIAFRTTGRSPAETDVGTPDVE